MNSILGKVLLAAVALAVSTPGASQAQQDQQTPRGWSYDVNQQGQRVARTSRVTKPDGSWREEIRRGNCLTIKERSATGEYRETRQCTSR